MDLIGTSMTGLAGKSLMDIFSVTTLIELVLVLFGGIIAVYIIPKIPYWFDDWIDRIFVIDFDEEMKKETSHVIMWTVYVAVLYATFTVMGFTRVHESPFFQLLLVLLVVKSLSSLLKPSMKKLDKTIKGVKVSEGSIMEKIMVSIIYLIGMFAALSVLGLSGALTTALAGAGIIGIVIGFGAQDIVSNTLSGIFIAIDKPFHLKDIIEVGGDAGCVINMGLRTTQIRKFDNKVVTVPNRYIASNPVTNYTAKKSRRISIKVGIDYKADVVKVAGSLKKALESMRALAKGKEVEVLIDEFGDSAIVLEVRVWLDQHHHNLVEETSRAREIVLRTLREEKVNIPFPTRMVISK